jgi:hypothetical protein
MEINLILKLKIFLLNNILEMLQKEFDRLNKEVSKAINCIRLSTKLTLPQKIQLLKENAKIKELKNNSNLKDKFNDFKKVYITKKKKEFL